MIRLLIQAVVCLGISLILGLVGLGLWQWQRTPEIPAAELERLWSQGRARMDRWQGYFATTKGPPKRRLRQANKRSGIRVRPCGPAREKIVFEQDGGALLSMGGKRRRFLQPQSLRFRYELAQGRPRSLCLLAGRVQDNQRMVVVLVLSGAFILGLLIFIGPLVLRLRRIEHAVSSLAKGDLQAPIQVGGGDVIGRLADGLRAMTARLQALFDARKRFSDAASHELRTPLARIAAALDLMEQHPDPELVAGMRADVRELNELVDELLLLARLEDPQRRTQAEDIDVAALLRDRAQASARGGRLVPELMLSDEAVMIPGDRRLLARLMDNLLGNAQRFARARIGVELRPEASGVLLLFEDDGPGVPMALVDRLFEPFVGGGDSGGLGLAIAQEIARVHGGELSYDAAALEGAGFRLFLPR